LLLHAVARRPIRATFRADGQCPFDGFTWADGRERATGIEPAFSAWEAVRARFHHLQKLGTEQLKPHFYLSAVTRCYAPLRLPCGTKSGEFSEWHVVARSYSPFSAMQAERG
jgi:hypothetical protein